MKKLIGRKDEIAILNRVYRSEQPQLVVVFGRRRVGKTYLINSYFENNFSFKITGAYKKPLSFQLQAFIDELSKKTHRVYANIKTWREAFNLLEEYILSLPKDEKKIIFFDEMPWLDTMQSDFIDYFSLFWNNFASTIDNLIFVACGSSSLWMNKYFVDNKGGLFNRKTALINLFPFKLGEVEEYLFSNGFNLSRYDIASLYMVFGGIPYYLQFLDSSKTITENIDFLLFRNESELQTEFQTLYETLFSGSAQYLTILKYLAKTRKGASRNDIIKDTGLSDNGDLTNKLNNLMMTGFIREYVVRNGKKETYYQLIDFFSLFYLKHIYGKSNLSNHYFASIVESPSYNAYRGLTFELICQLHIEEIKWSLQCYSIKEEHYSWSNPHCQIDLLIKRNDKVDIICENKFVNGLFEIDKKMHEDLSNKIRIYREESGTKNSIFFVFISTYGVKRNQYSSIIQKELVLDDLFVTVR